LPDRGDEWCLAQHERPHARFEAKVTYAWRSGSLTRTTALDVAGANIYVNAIASGPVLAPGFEDYLKRASAEQAKRLCQLVPLGRIGRPEESAPLAVYLASDEHSVIGQQSFLRKAVRSWSDTCRDHALSRPAPMGSVGCSPKLPVRARGPCMR
jgi:Enoyl-(Acyl carrier protein) reductase